jgi:PAS domain S-box-containing protein
VTVQGDRVPVTPVEDRVDALNRRFTELSDRVFAAASGSSGPVLNDVLQELAAALLELEVGAEEVRAQDESLALAQEQLDAAVTRYRELFDLAPDGYLVTDTNGIIVESNRAASQLLGCPARFLHRKPAIVFVDHAARRTVLRRLHDAVHGSTNRVVSFEAGFAPPNGRSFPASVHLTASRSGHTGEVSVRWLVRDEGPRLTAERALAESEARYRLLADSSSDVVMTTDGTGRIDYVSPSTLGVLAWTSEELEGGSLVGIVHPEDRTAVDALQEAALTGRPATVVCRVRRGDGRYLPVEAAVVPLARPGHTCPGLRYALRDVREREGSRLAMRDALALERHAAATLREADATKNALLLAAAHDLSTPVAAIAALAEILHRHPDLPAGEVAHIAEGLVSTSSQLGGILSNLLDAERIMGGYVVVRRTPVDLTELVAARARDLALGGELLTLPMAAVTAELDVGLTARIVDNLLLNAAHHTPADTAVHVGIAEDGDDLVVTVSDQGPGVPDDAREAIFRAFERQAGHQTGDGLGLGLFIVRRFAELQGGRAWVEDAPGGGAAFKVAFRRSSQGTDGR